MDFRWEQNAYEGITLNLSQARRTSTPYRCWMEGRREVQRQNVNRHDTKYRTSQIYIYVYTSYKYISGERTKQDVHDTLVVLKVSRGGYRFKHKSYRTRALSVGLHACTCKRMTQ